MGVPEEHQILLPHEPKSRDETLSYSRRVRGSDGKSNRTRKPVLHILGISVLFALLFISSRSFFFGSSYPPTPPTPPTPMTTATTSGEEMHWEDISMCFKEPRKLAKTAEDITFGASQSLSIVQKSRRDESWHEHFRTPRVFGQVELTPIHDGSSSGKIEMEITSNIETLDVNVEFDRATQEFTVTTPQFIEWYEQYGACIQIHINVSIPLHADLESLTVDAQQLNVDIVDGLALRKLQRTVVNTITGNVATGAVAVGNGEMVTPYALESKEVVIETVSGNVKGWFPFYDLVKIHTVSGDVAVDLTPQPPSASDEQQQQQQAVLDISSVSGHLIVKEKWSHQENQGLPIRDYVTHLTTASGHVEANVAFTSDARIESQSGHLTLQLVPVQDPSSSLESHLLTSTKSGRSEISILEPPSSSSSQVTNPLLSSLVSKHTSISGNLNLHYPSSWAGKFSMTTMTGRQAVHGQDVEFSRAGGFFHRIKGAKGHGSSEMTVDSMSGNEELLVGNV